jgi:hypothetical protein
MGLSIVQNALGTVQSIGRVRDTNRDGKGGYTDFYWLIKESGKREFNHYSKDSAAQYFKMSKHVKVKNSYEYFNYLILDNVNNIRNDYFNSIGINVVEKGLDDDIKAEVLIDILEHIQLTGDNAEYNPAEKINITLYGNDEAFEKMLKTVSNEGDKNIWEYCHHQNQQKAFLEYISDCKKDGKKLTFECVKDFYYKTHKGLERIERYINKLANGKKTVDTKTLSDCLQCDVKVVNDFMKSLMKSYANEVDGGYKSYKRFKFNGYAVNWDKIMSLSRKETQPLIDMIENVPIEFKSEATLKSEATVDNLFNDNDEQLIDNKKEYKKQADKQYYTETIKLKFRGGYKKFFTDYEKRKKQYKDIKATKKEQSEIELGMAEKMKIQLKIREFFDANMANQ